jgi:uncharacterized protein (DUF58 family)
MLLSPAELRAVESLSLRARRAFVGSSKGEKRSVRRGASVEFADFRAYNFGDDLRRVDWNAFGRFDKLFLKMFLEEEDLDITLILDASASMGFSTDDSPSLKWACARRLMAALGTIGLSHYDRVTGWSFAQGPSHSTRARSAPMRGRSNVPAWLRWCEGVECGGTSDFSAAMKRVVLHAPRPGLAIVVSDFLLPEGYETGMKALAARGFEVMAVQVLEPHEQKPMLAGDWKLVDVETGQEKEISMSAGLAREYERRRQEHTQGLRAFCGRYAMRYVLVSADSGISDALLRVLRPAGVVS